MQSSAKCGYRYGRNEATLRYEVSSIQKSTHSEKDVFDLFRRMYKPLYWEEPIQYSHFHFMSCPFMSCMSCTSVELVTCSRFLPCPVLGASICIP